MKRKKLRKLSLGKVTLGRLNGVAGGGRHYSDVMGCSNSCSDFYAGLICTQPTAGQELCASENDTCF